MKTLLLILFVLILSACSGSKELTKEQEKTTSELVSSSKPKLENFSVQSEVTEGTEVALQWWFSNAVSVYFPQNRSFYKASDKISFLLKESKTLQLIATNAKGDTSVHSFFVKVIPRQVTPDTYTIKGPVNSKKISYPIAKSTIESNFISGMIDFTESKIEQLFIRNIVAEDSMLIITVLPLDKNGNFIANIDSKEARTTWSATAKSGTSSLVIPITKIQENVWLKETPKPLDITIVLDKSATNDTKIKSILRQLLTFVSNTADEDRYSFYAFNQDVQTISASQSKKQMIEEIQNSMTMIPWGMSAPYIATYTALDDAISRKNEFIDPIIVLLVHSNDNASIHKNIVDVVNKARSNSIPVTVLSFNSQIDSYYYKLLTSSTGGAFYAVENSNTTDIMKILQEIYYSQKIGYTLTIPKINFEQINETFTIQVVSKQELSTIPPTISDEKNLNVVYSPEVEFISKFDSLEILESSSLYFNYHQSNVNPNYLTMLKNIATMLIKDPSKKILLVGNTSPKEFSNSKEHSVLADFRAKNVRAELVNYGVVPNQIYVKEVGASKPLQAIELSQWEEEFNRRVEILWLDPSRKPYEIKAGQVSSEYEAQQKVNEWNERGIKSYFDAYLEDKNPIYKVFLWGFATKTEAEETAKNLSKKYNVKLSVE